MKNQYLLKHLVQGVIFAILLMFSTNKQSYMHFIVFTLGFMAVNLLFDYIYGIFLDRKIRREIENLEQKET